MTAKSDTLALDDSSHIGVIGGGPAGAFFSYFLLEMAERIGTEVSVDIYESRDFSNDGPKGCNMCGGIVSESLVQTLATEGINLPPSVIRRGIDSYFLHMDVGSVKIQTPLAENRIGAVYRGAGPRGISTSDWESFDNFLLKMAQNKGANLKIERVENIHMQDGKPQIITREGSDLVYDLLVVAAGINTASLKLFQEISPNYKLPKATKTFICEYFLERETVGQFLGSSMHTYLLNIPRLEFAAIIPKGDYATVCMLGHKIDKDLVESFLDNPVVQSVFPSAWNPQQQDCVCYPKMNIGGAAYPYADRIVFIGDSGVSRLNKDGIGAAYRTSKAAAKTVVFSGISAKDFKKHYWPACRALKKDNATGRLIFKIVGQFQKIKLTRKAILIMVKNEQKRPDSKKRMSMILWDMFTGSAPYNNVFLRTFHPLFLGGFFWSLFLALWPFKRSAEPEMEDLT